MGMMIRPRRLRQNAQIRAMIRETKVLASNLIFPMFVAEGTGLRQEIAAMPGQYKYSVDTLADAAEELASSGVDKILLFGVPDRKDEFGSDAYSSDGITQRTVRTLKQRVPGLLVITDVCLCEYTSHGHCGVLQNDEVDNDETIKLLAKTAVSHVKSGADMVAPSDMMDGRVGAIRAALDDEGFYNTPVISYAVKYASSYYGPFREAADCAPAFGDRRGYQMDWGNSREALRETALDEAEGADILMVKPAMSYLDIIAKVRASTHLPVAAYAVSGEYAMIKFAAKAGAIDEYSVMLETSAGVFRAGADILVTYFAPELALAIRKGDL